MSIEKLKHSAFEWRFYFLRSKPTVSRYLSSKSKTSEATIHCQSCPTISYTTHKNSNLRQLFIFWTNTRSSNKRYRDVSYVLYCTVLYCTVRKCIITRPASRAHIGNYTPDSVGLSFSLLILHFYTWFSFEQSM